MNARRPSLLDPSFKYTPASRTNIAETFKRLRREQKQQAATVTPIKREPRRA